jgi:hypothetical protein
MIVAEINFADIMWSMLAFFFFVIILTMVFQIVVDIFRSDDLSGVSKALWLIAILFVPWLAIFIYLIVRGNTMAARSFATQRKAQEEFATYAASVAPPAPGPAASPATEIANAKGLLDSGVITQAEFDKLKGAALATP